MYASFFGFKDKPFNMTPDPRYLFLSESHEEALSALLYGIREKKGLMTLSGPVGVGKTTILFSFLQQIRTETEGIFFPGGITGSRTEFFRELCKRFHVSSQHDSIFDLTREIEKHLKEKASIGKNVVLVVDEAQDLSWEELTHFRYLNNLETTEAKFLQIILSGAEKLEDTLRDERLLSLRQRVAIHCKLYSLDPKSTVSYILHRLRIAGSSTVHDVFTAEALCRIANHSCGIPRRINVICDNAMVIAFALKRRRVEEAFVQEALESIEGKEGTGGSEEIVSLEEVRGFLREASAAMEDRAKRIEPMPFEEGKIREEGHDPEGVQGHGRGQTEEGRAERNDDLAGDGKSASGVAEQVQMRERSHVVVQDREPLKSKGWRTVQGGAFLLVGFLLGTLLMFLLFRTGEEEAPVPVASGSADSQAVVTERLSQGEPLRGETGAPSAEAEPEKSEGKAIVSEGQGMGCVVLEHYGRLNPEIYQALKEENPRVSDWNRLESGTELRLPVMPASKDRLTDFYTVQVASFLSQEKTEEVAAELCKRGIQNVFVITEKAPSTTGERWSCSCVGVFSGVDEAIGWQAEMRENGFKDAFITKLRGVGLADVLFPCSAH